ncbi:hypothetical protein GCM10010112_48750 [Actinoplanes lobatus]|nr:hypothetical protein GCM10010112_48750 [Actinoplanes lobatus]GIE40909.1 hypothetical protein Alo02nite_38070 [Actinoplanes lobatus]
MTVIKSWARRSAIMVGVVLFAIVGLGNPALAGGWNESYFASHCGATRESPVAGVYWQACSIAVLESTNPLATAAKPYVLISNHTSTGHYVQAWLTLWSEGSLKAPADSCPTILLGAGKKMTCWGDRVIIDYLDNQQSRGQIAIDGQYDVWAWGQTWTFR